MLGKRRSSRTRAVTSWNVPVTLLQANRERKGYSVTFLEANENTSCVLIPSVWISTKLPRFSFSFSFFQSPKGYNG